VNEAIQLMFVDINFIYDMLKGEDTMKWSTMKALREESLILKKAMDHGFDLPSITKALERQQATFADDELSGITCRVKNIIDKLNVDDLGLLVTWLFEGNVDPDSLIQEIINPYEMWAEKWLDEESERIAAKYLREAQALYNEIHKEDLPDKSLEAQVALDAKLLQIEDLTGQLVALNEAGVLEYIRDEDE